MTEPQEQVVDVVAQRLAGIYAEALLNAAEAEKVVPQILAEIDSLIDDVFPGNRELGALLTSGAIGRKVRTAAIEKAFKGRSSKMFYQFLQVLNRHERLDLIRPIRMALHELQDKRTRHLRVHVFSAMPLDNAVQERIKTAVRSRFQLEPVLVMHVDKALLGGLKVRIGDKVLDATLRTQIDNLRNQLIASSSHEIQSRRDSFSSAE
jgi:F-type H+-transporting ATPase subunit delta